MPKKKYILIILLILIIPIFLIVRNLHDNPQINPPGKIITTNPLDLSQISSISVFRGCVGHDYSALNINGEEETLRTMKHYITPTPELDQSEGQVKVFAPFNGTISEIDNDCGPEQFCRGKQIWIEPDHYPEWYFVFFHIDLLENITKNSKVKSGQLIGYADLVGGANFDLIMKGSKPLIGPNIIDSPFNYMSEDVLAEYEAVGITLDNIIHTKTYRDERPCKVEPGTESKHDSIFPGPDAPNDWVMLNHI